MFTTFGWHGMSPSRFPLGRVKCCGPPFQRETCAIHPDAKTNGKSQNEKKKKEIAVLFCYILECGCTQQLGAREDSAQIKMKPE
jgi:hypothetical protein